MLEQILPNVYRSKIPLPRNPLRDLNSYIVKGDGRFLVIDTGMNRPECKDEIVSDLRYKNYTQIFEELSA